MASTKKSTESEDALSGKISFLILYDARVKPADSRLACKYVRMEVFAEAEHSVNVRVAQTGMECRPKRSVDQFTASVGVHT